MPFLTAAAALAGAALVATAVLASPPAQAATSAPGQATITLTADHTVLSYDTQTVKFSGQVTVTGPAGTGQPYAGQEVDLTGTDPGGTGQAGPSLTVTTDGAGDFSGSLVVASPEDTVVASIPGSSTVAAGSSPSISFTAAPNLVHITATLNPVTVGSRQPSTLSGTATYQTRAGWVPLADYPVNIRSWTDSSPEQAVSVRTNAAGQYSLPITGSTSDTAFDVMNAPSSLLDLTVATKTLSVLAPTQISSFTASLSQQGTVTMRGCLVPSGNTGEGLPMMVRLQYATSPDGPWYTMATVNANRSAGGCDGTAFSGTEQVRTPWAFYRASFAGYADDLPSASSAVLLWKYLDTIQNVHIARHGTQVTVSGRLEYYYSGWHPYGHRQVMVVLEPQGGAKWYWIAKPWTNGGGWFTATVTYRGGAHWAAVYVGDGTHFATGTKPAWMGG